MLISPALTSFGLPAGPGTPLVEGEKRTLTNITLNIGRHRRNKLRIWVGPVQHNYTTEVLDESETGDQETLLDRIGGL